ncbi:2-hydroxy-6-oxononadienedioate/2-hydroxy-6-oxononatrienedioate hydrolase [Linum grandiflorum]
MNGSRIAISSPQFPNLSKTHPIYRHSNSFSNRSSNVAPVIKFLHSRSVSASASSLTGTFPPEKLPEKKKKKQIAGIEQDELLDPELLADPDSCFCEFRGVKIHHKIYESTPPSEVEGKNRFPIILLHGFGASVFSWSRATKRLAEATSAPKVVAFDRPAFGLTSRVDPSELLKAGNDDSKPPLNPYSMAFAVLATLYFVDFLQAEKSVLVGSLRVISICDTASASLVSECWFSSALLNYHDNTRHSAGCLVAVDTYFEAPDRVAALILVAPAIFAPNPNQNVPERDSLAEGHHERENNEGFLGMLGKPFVALLKILSRIAASIARTTLKLLNGMTSMLTSLYKKALSAVLCSSLGVMLIRMAINRFGVAAVKNAWYDPSQVGEEIVNGYTKPLRVKGWDKALAEFTAATLAVVESELRPPGSKRLHEISCPVLIVTGDTDRIVPAWNAKRLSQAIPGSSLEVIKDCGHLPHEEKVEEFVSVVQKFLQRAFSDMKEPSVQVQPT